MIDLIVFGTGSQAQFGTVTCKRRGVKEQKEDIDTCIFFFQIGAFI